MKHPSQRDENAKFQGSLRHYHRSSTQTQRTWDEWVDGKAAKQGSTNWLKVVGITVAILALGGVIAGLVIELS
jgi:hypothetical protein